MKTDLGATIEVAVALPVFGTYTYHLPDGLRPRATVGLRVLVPFGNRRVTGYILGRANEIRPVQIKTVLDLLDRARLFPEGMIPFFRWIAEYYIHPLGEVIRGALPSGLNLYEYNLLAVNPQACPLPENESLSALERDILACLQKGACRLKDLQNHLDRPIPGALLHAMIDCGWVVRRKTLRGGRTRPKRPDWCDGPPRCPRMSASPPNAKPCWHCWLIRRNCRSRQSAPKSRARRPS